MLRVWISIKKFVEVTLVLVSGVEVELRDIEINCIEMCINLKFFSLKELALVEIVNRLTYQENFRFDSGNLIVSFNLIHLNNSLNIRLLIFA